jgi:septum formation inhibitor MinC
LVTNAAEVVEEPSPDGGHYETTNSHTKAVVTTHQLGDHGDDVEGEVEEGGRAERHNGFNSTTTAILCRSHLMDKMILYSIIRFSSESLSNLFWISFESLFVRNGSKSSDEDLVFIHQMQSDQESVHSQVSKSSKASKRSIVSSNRSLDLNQFIQENQVDEIKEEIKEEIKGYLSPGPTLIPEEDLSPGPTLIPEEALKEMVGGGSRRERENKRSEKRERLKSEKKDQRKGKRSKDIPEWQEPQEPQEPQEDSNQSPQVDYEHEHESTPQREIIDELRDHMESTPSLTETAISKAHSYFNLDKFDEMMDQYPSYIKTGVFSTIIFVIAIILITLFELATFALAKKKVIRVKMVSDKGYLYDDENQMYLLYNPRFFSPLAILGYSNVNDKTSQTLMEDQLYEITVFSNSIKRIVIVEE